jgi:hypothetical protein
VIFPLLISIWNLIHERATPIRNKLIWTLVLAMLVVTMGHAADMDENDSLSESESDGARHRIDISAIFLDSVSSDSVNGILGYTYNLTSNSNISAVLPYLDPDLGEGGNSGFGDFLLAYSIVPSARISANPWVPRTIGSGLARSDTDGQYKERLKPGCIYRFTLARPGSAFEWSFIFCSAIGLYPFSGLYRIRG